MGKLSDSSIERAKPRATPYELRDSGLTGFLVRVQPSGVKTFYVEWARGKRLRLGRVGVKTFKQYATEAKRILAQAADKGRPDKVAQLAHGTSLEEFIDQHYAPWAQAQQRTGFANVKNLKVQFGHLYPLRLDELTAWHVDRYRVDRKNQGIQDATVNRDVTRLKAVLNKAVEWGALPANPLASVKPIKVDKTGVVRWLSTDEEARLRLALVERDARIRAERASGNRWRQARSKPLYPAILEHQYGDHLTPMVLVSMNTGLRLGELTGLLWSDINLEQRVLTVRVPNAKGKKARHVPLNREAVQVLTTWLEQRTGEAVFPNMRGQNMGHPKNAWLALLAAAGIEKFRWHDLRHHFASRLVMAGVDLNTVRDLLGHGDIKMTLRYAHLAPEHKAAAVERLMGGGS